VWREKGDEVVFEGRFGIWSVTSRDDGVTWGEKRSIYESHIWGAQSRAYISELSPNHFIEFRVPSHTFHHVIFRAKDHLLTSLQ
jgi:hypothetical protein